MLPLIKVLQKAVYKHGYLFITAAWLYTISFVFVNYWSSSSTPTRVQATLEKYIRENEVGFNEILENRSNVEAIIEDSSASLKTDLANENFGIFAYHLNDVGDPIEIYWNTNNMSPNKEDVHRPDGTYFHQYQNGYFELIKQTIPYKQKQYVILGLVPIRWTYFIKNNYLRTSFAGFPEIENAYKVSFDSDDIPIKSANGSVLFYIQEKPHKTFNHPSPVSIALRVFTVIFLLLFINALAVELVEEKGFFNGFAFLIIIIFILRWLSYFYNFPFEFRNLELFDPAIYASSYLHPSLGDLFINAVLLYWIVMFVKFNGKDLWSPGIKLNKFMAEALAIGSLIVLAFSTIQFAAVIRSLIVDSKISFDVTNFFGLSGYTVVSLAVICFIILSYYHLSHLCLIPARKLKYGLYWRIVVVVSSGLLLLSFNIDESSTLLKIATLAWLIIYLLLLHARRKDMSLPIIRSSFFIFWAMFFSASVSLVVIAENKSFELEIRKNIAEKLAYQTDPSGENLVNLAISSSNNFLVNNFKRLQSDSSRFLKDSLIGSNFAGYLNKFDTRIYTYNTNFQPLYNEDSTSYFALHSLVSNFAREGKTSTPNLYYLENNSDRFTFLFEKEIKDKDSSIAGYVFIEMNPRKYKSDALFPELFKESRDIESDLNTNYAFAIYNKLHLINNFNDYPFSDSLSPRQLPKFEFEQKKVQGYDELWYKAQGNKLVIIVRKNTFLVDWLTMFAYIFCSFIALVLLFHLANYLLKARFNWNNLKQLFRVSIRIQIQTTIIFISVFSFVVIGVTTISFFILRFNGSNRDKLLRSIQVMANEIQENMKGLLVFNDVSNLNDLGYIADFDRKILEISKVHNTDVTVYNVDGTLSVSTQPYIYNKQILSDKMQPVAYYKLRYEHLTEYLHDERIGNFYYVSIYAPIKDQNNNTIAYINIPYLNSENELNQEISNFVVTLINLNALIFVLAGGIALLLTNRITSSFELIGNKMKQINLGEKNEEISWDRRDEIGVLVDEYNKMVKKLDESAQALARSEREGAWQEMARQVAHEIKNPLTPMKLSIQYLQKAVNNNSANVKQLSQQVAATLVEQIDQLSKIAGDFAQFANIGNVTPVNFDITEVVESLVNLYQSDANMHIEWLKEPGNYNINSDKTQINRLFTNLIKNAIEASDNNAMVHITIQQYNQDGNVVISIADKGQGIPVSMQKKIFVPNFTTKSSGTGLGLAICKGIVEKANGKIWFQTEENVGTTFYVSLPLAAEENA